MPTIHIIVEGRVQGVSFRANARRIAESMHITGWVKNTGEGNVEIVASGTQEDLDEFVGWCKHGPALAKVNNLKISAQEDKRFDRFAVEV